MEVFLDHQYSSEKTVASEAKKSKNVCPICNKVLPPSSNMSFHMMLHPSDKPFACDFCVQMFKTNDDLWKHNCEKHPSELSNLCEICGKAFRHSCNLRRHRLLRHSNVMRYKCIYCDVPFKEYGQYRTHEAGHDRVTDFQCEICNVYFGSRKSLDRHVEKCQSNNNILQCCEILFNTRMEYVQHMLDKHKKYKQAAHKCQFCGKAFPYIHSKKAHEVQCNNEQAKIISKEEVDLDGEGNVIQHQCEFCDRVFNALRDLMKHVKTHKKGAAEKDYICNICNKKLSSYSSLYVHKAQHLNIKKHFCDVCNKGFLNHANLVSHKVVHTKEKPFKCSYCDKSFSYKTSRRVHERTHTGECRFSCDYCDMKFTRFNIKQIHERRHTGEKPYSCRICGKSFTQDSTRKQHELTHSDSIECKYCVRQFKSKKEYKMHRRGGQCKSSEETEEFETIEEIIAIDQIL